METVCFSETFVTTYESTQCQNPEQHGYNHHHNHNHHLLAVNELGHLLTRSGLNVS
jgi:hypothetical protein